MKSGIGRFIAAAMLCLSSGLTHNMAIGSTWVPIKGSKITIFIPKPGLESVQAESFQYGTEAVLTLNGFGATSAIYYQTQSYSNGVLNPPGSWVCQDKTTLASANNSLKIGAMISGRYQVNVIASMANELCDPAFTPGQHLTSDVIASNQFMVINHHQLTSSNAALTQDTTKVTTGPNNIQVLAKYDLHMNWPAVEGVDAYQVTLIKDNVSYTAFNGVANPMPLADLTGTQFSVIDEFFPGETIEQGTFTDYTGPGEYSFSIGYCFNGECSQPISYNQTISILPLMPSYYIADSRADINRLNGNEVQFWWVADKRTTHFAIAEQRLGNTTAGNEYTQLEEILPNHNTRGIAYQGTPNYVDEGQRLRYLHVTARPYSGHYRYYITGCTSNACQANYLVASDSMELFSDSTLPYGQLDGYALGKAGNAHIKGWAFDDNITDGSGVKTNVRLKINGYSTTGYQQVAELFSLSAGDYHGFDFDLESMINSSHLLQTSDVLQLELWAYDHGGSAANEGYVLIDELTINKLLKDKPVAVDDMVTLKRGETREINVTFNDVDWDEDTLLLTPINLSAASHGTVQVQENGRVLYTSNGVEEEVLSDGFTYQVSDRLNQVSDNTATVVINFAEFVAYDDVSFVDWEEQTGQVVSARQSSNSLIKTGSSDALIATFADRTITLDVRSNDYNAGLAQVVVDTQGSSGSVVADNEGRLVYTLNGDAPLSDSFSYHLLVGGKKTSNSANVYLNTSPTPVADHLPVSTNTRTILDVTSNDHRGVLSGSHQLVPAVKKGPEHGTLRIVGGDEYVIGVAPEINPVIEYMPDHNFNGTDTFSYSLEIEYDGFIKFSRTATVTIEVGTPPAPLGNMAVTVDADEITHALSWTGNGGDAYPLEHYFSKTSVDIDSINPGNWSQITLSSPTATSHTVVGDKNGYYYYRARACIREVLCSSWSKVQTQISGNLDAEVTSIADATVVELTRPDTNDIVGQLAGSGQVSGGNVNYNIPIEVPPGRRGVEPALAFNYNSSSGNGLLGKGWSLTGQSVVARCAANWTEDGTVDRVDLQNDDKLCLDGQKLVLVSGSYGGMNSEYRTREDSFSKIVLKDKAYSDAGSYFEVTSKNGQISYYGDTTDSVFKPKDSSVPLSWAINKIYDNVVTQNNINFVYSNANGEQRLTDIYYTGKADDNGDRQVHFTYADRSDVSFGYTAGGSTKTTQRLTDVTTYVGSTKVFNYHLNYHAYNQALNGHSRLASVRQCGYEGESGSEVSKCLPKKDFSYSGNYQRFEQIESTNTVFNSDYPWAIANQMLSDFNNDGVVDFARNDKVHLMSFDNNQYVIEQVLELPFISYGAVEDLDEVVKLGQLDFDGDGQLEFIGVSKNGQLSVATLDEAKSGFTETELAISMQCYVVRTHSQTYNGQMTSSLDFKPQNTCRAEAVSDGTGGHYLFHRSAGQDLYLSRIHPECTDNLCGNPQLVSGLDKSQKTVSKYHEKPPAYQFFDFDGDGDPDIARLEEVSEDANAGIRLVWFRNDETGDGHSASNNFVKVTVPIAGLTKTFAMASGGNHWIDANGDGLQDLLINSGQWYLLMNQGGTLSAPIDINISHFDRSNISVHNPNLTGSQYTTHASIRIVDFNADGLQDIMYLDRAVAVRANGNNDPDQRDCLSDRERAYCKEGTGSESASHQDFSISPLAYGKYSVYLAQLDSSGKVTFANQETDIVGSVNNFYPLDVNSDGSLDFIGAIRQYDGTTIFKDEDHPYPSNPTQVFFHLGKSDDKGIQPDLLQVAKDQANGIKTFGQQDSFVYLPFSQHKVATSGSAAVDNSDLLGKRYYRIPSTQIVAVQHNAKNALGGTNTINYVYGDAYYHQAGLGFLGFDTITTTDVTQGTTSQVDYSLDYPLNGKTNQTEVRVTTDDTVLQSETLTWCDPALSECDSKETGVYFTYLKESLNNSFDPDGIALKTEQVTYDHYDDYGNVTQQTTVITDASTTHTTVVDNVYLAADETNWWVDKVDYAEVTKSVSYTTDHGIVAGTNGNKTQRRTLTYKAGNARQVASETIIGSDTELGSVTTYNTYDSYGNASKVTHSGVAESSVAYTDIQVDGITEYDYSLSDGYFVNSEKNGLWSGNTVTRTWDSRFGAILTETNINGVVLTNQLDWFGRVTLVSSNLAPPQDIIFSWGGDGIFATTIVQDGGATSIEAFDRDGQVVKRSIQAFAGNAATEQSLIELFSYDALGRLVEQVAPHFSDGEQAKVSYSNYDVLNRYGTKAVDRSSENYTVTYEHSGIDTTITVDAGTSGTRSMTRSYNAMNQLMSTKDADGHFTFFNYDANDNAIVVKDVAGNLITAKFDGFGYKQWFNDPNLGRWEFRHNGLGQLRWQKDANSVETRFDYDGLGRQTKRYIANQLDSTWVFDTQAKGQLSSETRDDLYKQYFYDDLGRVIKQTTNIAHSGATRSFDTEYAYDGYYGRVKGMRYPTGELLAYQFDQYGYASADVNPNEGNTVYRSIAQMSQHGKVISRGYGNGLYGRVDYTKSGDVKRVCVNSNNSCAGSASLDEIHYDTYDNFGNLRSKKDLVNNIQETYNYDTMHRIESSTRSASGIVVPTFSPAAVINYSFDVSGNLLSKADYATNYSYAGGTSGGPNAVKSITKLDNSVVNFSYDANGNLETGDGLSLSYNGLNKPIEIIRNSVTLVFEYGADEQRYKQTATHANKTVTTFYVDKVFEQVETTQNGATTTEKRHYLGDYAVRTHKTTGKTLSYLHRNRLGSTSLVTSGDLHLSNVNSFYQLVLERRGYDVFGKPRDLYWGDSMGGILGSLITSRGFTDHEHLDDVELIHMNGRGYDYNLGRFLSVDPFIQMPGNSQSINPYSYGMNNPLAGTDPSGYLFWFIPVAIAAYNVYDSATAIADAAVTLANPDVSMSDKVVATAEALGSVIDPTPGNLGKNGVKLLRTAAKGKKTAKVNTTPAPSKSKTEVKTEPAKKVQQKPAAKGGDSGGDKQKDAGAGDVNVDKGCSFTAETLILTQTGYRSIAEVEPGELVLAKSDNSQVTAWRLVTNTFKDWHQQTITFTVIDENGLKETITTTAEHPFYLTGQGWLPAGDIELGAIVAGPNSTDLIRIVDIQVNDEAEYAYNFTVDIDYTYFVGQSNMWVHNTCDITGGAAEARAGGLTDIAGPPQVTRGQTSGRLEADGVPGPRVKVKYADGSTKDITGYRVKETVPNVHPKAPPGASNKVKNMENPVNTTGTKREPTDFERKLLEDE